MRTADIKKLVDAGFTVLSPSDFPKPSITFINNMFRNGRMKLTYSSKELRDEILEESLKDDNVILD